MKRRIKNPRKEKESKLLLLCGFLALIVSFLLHGQIASPTFKIIAFSGIMVSLFVMYSGLVILPRERMRESQEYLKKGRPYIFSIMCIFVLFMVSGFALADEMGFIDQFINELIRKTVGLSGIEMILFIFINNVKASFFGLFVGIVFGLFPIANAIMNGTVLGYVFKRVYEVTGVNDFWRILPHGIFELPAIFISLGLGIKLGWFIFSKNPGKEIKERFWSSLIIFLRIVIPLLIIAACIEGTLITVLE